MISPYQVADYWSLRLLDFDWLKLYGRRQVLIDRPRVQILPIGPYRWAADEQFDQ